MALNPNTKLGPYEILSSLGAGGMGEVYCARDSRLDREVAIKVLPEALAADTERILRFEREAKALATLSHANIAAIYGFEEHDGKRLLVMELAEGETLNERLQRGALPLDESLETARMIAAALEAAHDKGIVHRDLKPANVKIASDGTVKVLDFGLAKALIGEGGSVASMSPTEAVHSPTITAEFTRPGVILGTAGYMSPEQARGRSVDKRTDIWAFGCVLFECLSGARLFSGETATDSIGAILHKEPEWALLPPQTPPTIQLLLRRCLAKDRNRRLRDIGDARIEIETAIADPSATSLGLARSALAVVEHGPRRPLRWVLLGVGLLAAMGAGAGLVSLMQPGPPVRKFEIPIPDLQKERGIAIAPDGRRIAYVQDGRIWIRDLDRLKPRDLAETQDARNLFWSPDSAYVGYMRHKQLWKTSIHGGVSVVCALPELERPVGGAGWSPSGKIAFTTGNGDLYEVAAQGGEPRALRKADDAAHEVDFHNATQLPDGRGVVYVLHTSSGPDTIELFANGVKKVLLHQKGDGFFSPVYSPSGHLLFTRTKTTPGIWALPFSLSKLEVTGEPFLAIGGASRPSVSSDGTLAYLQGDPNSELRLAWVDRGGKVLETFGRAQSDMFGLSLSPDGTRVVIAAKEGDSRDLWVHDLARGTKTRLTFSSGDEWGPRWSRSGKDIAYSLENGRLAMKSADGVGQEKDLGEAQSVGSFTLDDQGILVVRNAKETVRDLWLLPLGSDLDAKPLLQTPAEERNPRLSPDGSLLAYQSDDSGHQEIYLTRFPSGEGKWQVSIDGGAVPVWNPNGQELFFLKENSIFAVDVQGQPSLVLGTPKMLVDGDKQGLMAWRGFDVAADGERFILPRSEDPDQASSGIIVVENWFSEFKNRP